MDKIFIKGLALDAVVGIYEHERTAKQPIIIDLELFTDVTLSATSGLITHTIDYDLVVARVSDIVEKGPFELIESLALRIINVLLAEFKADEIRCTVYKPRAVPNAKTVGISLSRKRF